MKTEIIICTWCGKPFERTDDRLICEECMPVLLEGEK